MVIVCIVYLDLCFKPTEVHNVEALYDQWLQDWLNHLISGSHSGIILVKASHIQTPLPGNIIYETTHTKIWSSFSWKAFQMVSGWDIMAVPCNQLGRI